MKPELDAIRRFLLEEWDPIGVKGIPEASDEYDMYVIPLYDRLHSGATADAITDYLEWIVTDQMGLTGNRAHSREIAAKAIAIHAGHARS